METINLLNDKEFCPNLDIKKRLEEGAKSHSLIYTNKLRGIGKTISLVEFAREYDMMLVVIHGANDLIRKYGYKNICNHDQIRVGNCYRLIIDEGVKFNPIITEDSVFTGFTTEKPLDKKEDIIGGTFTAIPFKVGAPYKVGTMPKKSFDDKILEGLKSDAESLSEKLKENSNNSDYKMLINNLKTTMELIQELEGKEKPTTINISSIYMPKEIDSENFVEQLKLMSRKGCKY